MTLRDRAAPWAGPMAAVGTWLCLTVPMAAIVGSLCALFLWSLDRATQARLDHPWLLYGLPVAGVVIGFVYHWVGRSAEGGNNLIVDQIHEPGGGVPLRMAPLILVSTVVTHLFGGSAGREGTAVQLGGSIAGGIARLCRLDAAELRILLMGGIAAGFGAVFGTPVAGAVFALEVLTIGRIQYEALIPCLIAAVTGDWVCHAWGVGHVHYPVAFLAGAEAAGFTLDGVLLAKVAIAGIAFGLSARLFSEASHLVQSIYKTVCPYAPLRPAIGGLLVIGLVHALGTREYLGIGVIGATPEDASILNFFISPVVHDWSWLWKMLFTVVTLGAGFKGGEVTPLFFIGAGLGNALSGLLGAPPDLFAALGFVAVFAGAANTPLACVIMGIELFGAAPTVYLATACFLAYMASGHSSIYLSQRVGIAKRAAALVPPDITLRDLRQMRSAQSGSGTARVVSLATLRRSAQATAPSHHVQDTNMPHPHRVSSEEVGMVRIYLKPGERLRTPGRFAFFGGRPVYRELVLAAKRSGILNAVAHHTHFGYSNHGGVEDHAVELANPHLTMCVELIAPRDRLELFCREHGPLLERKVVIYKELEQWRLAPHGESGEVSDMTPAPTVA